MGFGEGKIVFNSVNDTFLPGQRVSGRLEFPLSKDKSYRGLYVEIKGFCSVHWTTTNTRKVGDRSETYTVTHESYEEYLNQTIYLAGDKHNDHTLSPGEHSFPFECPLPLQLPSSFEGTNGHVRYVVKAVVDRSFNLNQTKSANFKVVAPLDLNTNPYCKEPIELEFHQSYCCWCRNIGSMECLVKMRAGGACPGDSVPVELSLANTSTVDLTIKISLLKEISYRAVSEPATRYDNDTVLAVSRGPVSGGATSKIQVDMQIPNVDVLNFTHCNFIDVRYTFQVEVCSSGCHSDDSDSRPFFIGSVPVAGALPALSPLALGGSSFPPPPVTSQPFPTNTPYPNPPAIGITYPTGPGGNPPYPTGPGINPPYPAGPGVNPPYPPMGNQSFGVTPPYPASPFPAPYPNASPYGSSHNIGPYPSSPASSPYPPNPTNTPYSPNPYPNSGRSSPYPPAPGPTSPNVPGHPGVANTQLLKSADPGFGPKDGVTVPLLPPGAGVPYPTSPYASASAPEPSTPDILGKPIDNTPLNEENPPFNPNFK